MNSTPPNDYEGITYESFKDRANNPSLSRYQKVGFPDAYREGKEIDIFRDIYSKLKLNRKNITVLDIGCGCSELADHIIDNSEEHQQTLLLNDSNEMLDLLPDKSCVRKVPGKFPENFDDLKDYYGKIDVIIVYSVFHYVTIDSNPYNFIDKALELLNYGGLFLLGDLQNLTKRNRFFQSKTGIDFHHEFTKDASIAPPEPTKFPDFYEKIDDGLILGIMQRYRNFGFETYLLPQAEDLPMANRREDILILKN
jgi:cyclopropane fatty-acyl-phospholipid synthase-like methyltransferase